MSDTANRLICAGVSASLADIATYPLDTIKVRIQVASGRNGIVSTFKKIVSNGGVRKLYSGLPAGLQRQVAFSSIRIGLYEPVKEFYSSHQAFISEDSEAGLMGLRIAAGLTTGALAVAIAQPTEVVKIKMQGGSKSFPSCFAAYSSIVKKQGVPGLWRGVFPNMLRNSIVNCAEVVTYDSFKSYFTTRWNLEDVVSTHILCGLCSGLLATFVASPIDVIKTRYMNSCRGEYTGVVNCAVHLTQENGLLGFYKGFLPSFLRIAGWNICMFVLFEQAQALHENVDLSPRRILKKTQAEIVHFIEELPDFPHILPDGPAAAHAKVTTSDK